MDTSIRRIDIGYTIISRFEETTRNLIAKKLLVLFGDFREGISDGILERTIKKANMSDYETPIDFLEYTDFPDLKEIITYKGLYRYYFSIHILSQNEFVRLMDDLYQLRCRIAHARGIFSPPDVDELFEKIREITYAMEEEGRDLLTFLDNLEQSPEKFVVSLPEGFISSEGYSCSPGLLNNLPTPDYEFEGGFVGREEDIKKVISLLQGDLHRVITITGAGGVGKTALALRVIQRILDKSPTHFDGIIWLSAKESRLSVVGIEEIEPTLKNYEELLDTIIDVMGFGTIEAPIEQKEKDVNIICELYNRLLVVVDNLETITDDRIINFILDAPAKIKILITSRRGLGQVERRHELNQLKEKEAAILFRQIALEKSLASLAKLDDETIKIYVRKLACYPLAIKWVIGHVALGKDINIIVDAVTKERSDIALFCFDQIYNSLHEKCKKLLCTLSIFDNPLLPGILQYVANLTPEEFEDAIRDLILVSFIIPEQKKDENNDIITKYNLLSLTRGFVRNQLDHDTVMKKEIEVRMRTVQATLEEAERAKKQYKFSLHNLGATTDEEKIAALLAQTAYQKYQSGRYAEAVDDYKRASEIAPRFASVYRNWAVMESTEGHSVEADRLMRKAADLSPNDPQIWLTWGNMKRKEDRIKEALEYYMRAKGISPSDYVILNALGQAKSRLGDYAEADQLFRTALGNEVNPLDNSIKHEIINRTSLAENLKRWAEALTKDRNYTESQKKLTEALEQCKLAMKLDESDQRTSDLYRQILLDLGYAYKKSDSDKAIKYLSEAIVKDPSRFKETRYTVIATKEIIKLYLEKNDLDSALSLFTPKLSKLAQRTNPQSFREIKTMLNELKRSDHVKGTVIHVNCQKGFCIIESTTPPGDTYLGHVSEFIPMIEEIDLSYQNKLVTFFPEIDHNDKKRAKRIKLSV